MSLTQNPRDWCSVLNDIVLFPSSLIHGVFPKKGTNTRISLSFNVFFKGKIGNAERLTELTIKTLMELIPLFPIPVYISNLERKLTKKN